MAKPDSIVDKRIPQPAGGLRLVAEGGRYQILDDMASGLAIVTVANGQGKNYRLTTVKIPRPDNELGWKIIEYAVDACRGRVGLVPFVLQNNSTMKLAEYLYRYRSKSIKSMKYYASQVRGFCNSPFVGRTPDEVVTSCFDGEGVADRREVHRLSTLVDQYLREFEAKERTQGTLSLYQARMISFFKVNGIRLDPLVPYEMDADNLGRAPTQEELQRMLDVAPLREKAMIAVLAVTGMRVGTLLKLRYGHIKEDYEARRFPIHIHLEKEILKGKGKKFVRKCDTFLSEEATDRYLKPYLDERRRGTEKIPPDVITDQSFLFVVPAVDQATRALTTRPLSENTFWGNMHRIFIKANLTAKEGRTYDLRPHCLRKYFKTNLEAVGMKRDYVEYMMGHKISTYHDVASLGVERLRAEYANANLRIQPQPQGASLNDLLKAIIRAHREEPSRYLKEGIVPAVDVITPEAMTDLYAREVWDLLKNEVTTDVAASLISPPDERLAY